MLPLLQPTWQVDLWHEHVAPFLQYHSYLETTVVNPVTTATATGTAIYVANAVKSATEHTEGLVGSSNNPISGVTVCVVLVTALLLRIYLQRDGIGPPATIYVSAMIACAGSISGDNMQDLKTGHMIGATPWKQQIMLIVGVTSSAFVMPPILNLLNDAYGM